MTTSTRTEASAKKDVTKLQRAIVDGLEDVKAVDIQVFNTEDLSPLFERVIVASGNSNRQTKALASSVREAVKDAGFPKPRIEGEVNGEWIIVDCGAAVAHIMQPAIRAYYRLEEIWGETPVRLKLGAPKPKTAAEEAGKAKPKRAAAKKVAATPAVPARKPGISAAAKAAAAKTAAAKPAAGKKPAAKKSAAPAKTAAKPVAKAAARLAPKPAVKKTAAKKPVVKTVVVNKPAVGKKAAPAAKKAAAPAKKAPARKA